MRCENIRKERSALQPLLLGPALQLGGALPTLAKKNRYSRGIHEIDPQRDHVISRDIHFDLQRELATRSYRESRRCQTEAQYRTISHDRTVDQPHEFLGCNDFFGQGSISNSFWY